MKTQANSDRDVDSARSLRRDSNITVLPKEGAFGGVATVTVRISGEPERTVTVVSTPMSSSYFNYPDD